MGPDKATEAQALRDFDMHTKLAEVALERSDLFAPREVREILKTAARVSDQITDHAAVLDRYEAIRARWLRVHEAVKALTPKPQAKQASALALSGLFGPLPEGDA